MALRGGGVKCGGTMRGAMMMIALVLATQVAHADIVIKKVGVEVAPKKANGDAWDRGLGKEPDPQIDVRVDGKHVHDCPPGGDTFHTECAVSKQTTYGGAIEIELRVEDADVAADDAVGHARGQIPADSRGRFELAVDGQLVSAWVEVEDAEGPSFIDSVKARFGVRTIGALFGILIALLLYRIYGAKLLSPADVTRTEPPRATLLGSDRDAYEASGEGDREKPREYKHVNFWRSPILLASAGASIAGIVLANLLRDPNVPIALGSIPYVLGGFGFTAPIIDAYKHEHLGGKRLRLVIAGVAAMFAVPLFDFFSDLFTGIAFLARHIGWAFVAILLVLCLL
jgi:hypothetical protein